MHFFLNNIFIPTFIFIAYIFGVVASIMLILYCIGLILDAKYSLETQFRCHKKEVERRKKRNDCT